MTNTETTKTYTLSLHDALPISRDRHGARARDTGVLARGPRAHDGQALRERDAEAPDVGDGHATHRHAGPAQAAEARGGRYDGDRKSTRLNSSHSQISYAVFCLK